MNARHLQSKCTISICIHTVNQVVNDNISLSSRLSVPFNLWISVRNQWILCISRTFCFLRFNWAIVSRYEINWGPRLFSFFYGVIDIQIAVICRSRMLAWQSENYTDFPWNALLNPPESILSSFSRFAKRIGERERHSRLVTYSQYSFRLLEHKIEWNRR